MTDTNEIEIRRYTKAELSEEINKPVFFEGQKYLPITKHRAISHIKNPHADSEDVLLLVAFSGGAICGYIGVLPNFLYYQHEKIKAGWLTTWWVAPEIKGRGLGYRLMKEAFDSYNNRILAISASDQAFSVLKKSNELDFISLGERVDYVLKYPVDSNVPFVKRTVIPVINRLFQLKMNRWLRKNRLPQSFTLEETKEITPEIQRFINEANKENVFHWGKTELEWVMNFPWVITTGNPHPHQEYYFSSHTRSFFYTQIVVRKNNEITGYVILLFRNNFATLLFSFFDEENADALLYAIAFYLKKYAAYSLVVTHHFLHKTMFQKRFPFQSRRSNLDDLMVSKTFHAIDFSSYVIHAGVGDRAFT